MREEVFKVLGNLLVESIQGRHFERAYLNIEYASDVSGLDGEYINEKGQPESLELETDIKHFNALLQLKKDTQFNPLKHIKWNRAKFTLYPTGRFDIEYMWDEELQREVDKYNNGNILES